MLLALKCIICGEPSLPYNPEKKCCDGVWCGCEGKPVPNKNYPKCDKHMNDRLNRDFVYFLEYGLYKHGFEYCLENVKGYQKETTIEDYINILAKKYNNIKKDEAIKLLKYLVDDINKSYKAEIKIKDFEKKTTKLETRINIEPHILLKAYHNNKYGMLTKGKQRLKEDWEKFINDGTKWHEYKTILPTDIEILRKHKDELQTIQEIDYDELLKPSRYVKMYLRYKYIQSNTKKIINISEEAYQALKILKNLNY